ncbi:MAG: YkgJ family cysteine cluster protein [Dissulfurimicrobium sp.]|uniref:YkgJ family cysteine cluster protein n=1 Tax=Dissulfurimicrobium sp. TaxID=2022436 RepID=UPI00404B2F17
MDDLFVSYSNDLKRLFQSIDAAIRQICSQYPVEFRCQKGCSDCCYAVFDVSYIEALTIYHAFSGLNRKDRRTAIKRAQKALAAWNKLFENGVADPSLARIRCPLLTDAGECACYDARPVNCRTYGLPTVIAGKAHVCGLSGFVKGLTYPTIKLGPIQEELLTLSIGLGGNELGKQRWPIAAILLHDVH